QLLCAALDRLALLAPSHSGLDKPFSTSWSPSADGTPAVLSAPPAPAGELSGGPLGALLGGGAFPVGDAFPTAEVLAEGAAPTEVGELTASPRDTSAGV
ncbi:MAG TPA: hypothetical protein VNU24_03320, partial [Solirubrobacteraceae bacterium]|nr:hypothetical protein [Solirubrobacteraceae bacterium]